MALILVEVKFVRKIITGFILFGMSIVMMGCNNGTEAVSLYTTKNSPVVYNSTLYFYSEDMTIAYENQSSEGIVVKNQGGFLYNIEKRELYYDSTDSRQSILVSNENDWLCNYISQNKIEESARTDKIMEVYNDFLIEKQTITYEKNGGNVIANADSVSKKSLDKSMVEKLESKYGEVIYNVDEFENIEEIYFIKAGCVSGDEFLKKYTEKGYFSVGDFYDTEIPEIFIGIIIKKDNNYYYGNLNNRLSDELIEELELQIKKD